MKVTFLGVGSAFSRKYANSNLLIESGDIKLMVDCAHSGPRSLEKYGLLLKDITHIFMTHLHADHISGMEEFAFRSKFIYKQQPLLMSTASLLDRLWNASLRGGLEYIEQIPGQEARQTLADFFTPEPVASQTWLDIEGIPGLRMYLHPTNHVLGMESYGLELEERPGGKAKRFFFSGDTKCDPALIRHGAQTCSKVFHDCQLYDSGKENEFGVHASYMQLSTLPAEIRQKMWLYHYGDTPLPHAEGDGFAGFVAELQSFTF